MSLDNARMSAVLEITARVLGKRAEREIKTSPAANCLDNIATPLGMITGLVLRLRGERLARRVDEAVALVLEFDLRGELNRSRIVTTADLSLLITATASPQASIVQLGLAYDTFTLTSPIAVPDEVARVIDDAVKAKTSGLLADISMPLDFGELLSRSMIIVGQPELTLAGESAGVARVLALGIEIMDSRSGPDATIDRDHFLQAYDENFVPPSLARDWGLQVDAALMERVVQDRFELVDIRSQVDNWVGTDYRKAYWSGNGLDWDYKGWQDYVPDHYPQHPIWMACRGSYGLEVPYLSVGLGPGGRPTLIKYKVIKVGVYWFAYADLRLDSGRLLLDPYLFEIGLRNSLSYVLPKLKRDIDPIDLGSSELGGGLSMTDISFTTDHLLIRGTDSDPALPGEAGIEVPDNVKVDYLMVPLDWSTRDMLCYSFGNDGTLVDGAVAASFTIKNSGGAPLWLCALNVSDDPDGVFSIDPPLALPISLESGESTTVRVLMSVPQGDHDTHYGSLALRCNNFTQPNVSIGLQGVKMPKVDPLDSTCLTIPGRGLGGEELGRILDLVYGWAVERHPEIAEYFPPIPQPGPDPPCPACGIYVDVAISGMQRETAIEVRDATGQPVEHSWLFGKAHFLTMPITKQASLSHILVTGDPLTDLVVRVGISWITRVGFYRTRATALQVTAERNWMYVRDQQGIEVVDISRPEQARLVGQIDSGDYSSVAVIDNQLFARAEGRIDVYDVADPSDCRRMYAIGAAADSAVLLGSEEILISDRERVRTYRIGPGVQHKLVADVDAGDGVQVSYIQGAHRLGDIRLLHRLDEERSKLGDSEFVLQDDYLLSIYGGGEAIEILKKDMRPLVSDLNPRIGR